jgi:TrmH family RNA methyltransferase
MISSIQNPNIQMIRRLMSRSKDRQAEGAFVVEGVRLLEEAQKSGWEARLVIYSEELNERGKQLVELFRDQGTRVEVVSTYIMDKISDTMHPQGILGVLEVATLPVVDKLDYMLILDQIRDPGNMGTIIRTASAAGVQVIYLSTGSVDPFSPKVLRGGMGAHFRLPIYNATWEEIRSHVKRFELHCVLAAIDRGRAYFEADFRHPLSLIIGGETHGAGDDARQLADTLVKIPMPGGGDSLNASVAAGIILFEISRQKEINI